MRILLVVSISFLLSLCLEAIVKSPTIHRFAQSLDVLDVALSKDASTVALVWKELIPENSETESLYLQFFDPDGTPTTAVIPVANAMNTGAAKIAFDQTGNLIIAYKSESWTDIIVGLYSSTGEQVSSPYILGPLGVLDAIGLNSDNTFYVLYHRSEGVGQSSRTVRYISVFSAAGVKIGSEYLLDAKGGYFGFSYTVTSSRTIKVKPADGLIEAFMLHDRPRSEILRVEAYTFGSDGEVESYFRPVPDEERNPPILYEWLISSVSTNGDHVFLTKPSAEAGTILVTDYDSDGLFEGMVQVGIDVSNTELIDCALYPSGELVVCWVDEGMLVINRYSKEREILSASSVELSVATGAELELRPLGYPLEGVYGVSIYSPSNFTLEVVTFEFPSIGIPDFELAEISSEELEITLSTRRHLDYEISTTEDFDTFNLQQTVQGDGTVFTQSIPHDGNSPIYFQITETVSD